MIKRIYDFVQNDIVPEGFERGVVYVIDAGKCFKDEKQREHTLMRLAVCVQGLVNRGFKKYGTAIALDLDGTDGFWLNYITGPGKTYNGLERKYIFSKDEMLELFAPFMRRYGIVAWDKEVASTANVASTICGIEGGVPVMQDDRPHSLFTELKEKYGVPVKTDLSGMFGSLKKGDLIPGTNRTSTGSKKCDAYIWAMEKYFDKCNPELLAYTPDGAVEYEGNPVSKSGDASMAKTCGIPNHDYFFHKQCFFFDLTSYAGEAPSDEPDQPLGTDAATLKELLKRRYDSAKGKFGMALGFPPWHVKYTRHVDGKYTMDPARLEWHFVELTTTFNCGIEADAAHPCWMSNGSLYTNYERTCIPRGNRDAQKIEFDPDTYYFTVAWSGDFDCSPWMKMRVPQVWAADENRGKIPLTYGYNLNLVDRIPMAFDYIFENQTESDFIVGGEGMGYTIPDALFEGFIGKEANLDYEYWTRYPGKENHFNVRELPDGDEAYYDYAKPYAEDLKIDIFARTIDGFSVMSDKVFALYNRIATRGSFMQNTSAGKYDLQIYEGTPYTRIMDVGGQDYATFAHNVRLRLKGRDEKFMAIGFCDMGTNVGTPSGFKEFLETFYAVAEKEDPDTKYQYVDINTYIELIKQSGRGEKIN